MNSYFLMNCWSESQIRQNDLFTNQTGFITFFNYKLIGGGVIWIKFISHYYISVFFLYKTIIQFHTERTVRFFQILLLCSTET